ncbi:MAG: energy-coupling factor ABC transporter ATP-binding protein [Synergistaceae bacterium]|jgi:cobalt/nickel transport system ATP-binding protein|nr:energy-coupling factor ABC transporter ATP-binding protein [Synergistaceae bacterium]
MVAVPYLLEVRDLSYSYPDGTPALDRVSISLPDDARLAVVGANGSGKSTLLMAISGCFKAGGGDILIRGDAVGHDLPRLRGLTGLVFQDPDDQLFMPSVLEDVAFGLISGGADIKSAYDAAMSCLESLGAGHLAERPPHRLSGGERRIAALAGIMVMRPEIFLLDEPTSSLDPRARREVIRTLAELSEPIIMATHDLDAASRICKTAVVLQGGRVAASGPATDILSDLSGLEQYGL